MRRRTALITLTFATLAVVGVFLVRTFASEKTEGDPGAGQKQKRIPVVAVEVVRTEPISRLLELTGETVAVESVAISATVEGPISYCPWREGDCIEQEGQKLIEIDRELYRAEVNTAEAAVEVARAKLADLKAGTRPEEIAKAHESVRQLEEAAAFAQADHDRIAKLVESGSLPGE
jgi:multidrug efflux pump subunit AcrA (membrane-fusion protein)